MNIHHLELFYYVAKFEGITAAVRKMPYGIQQPAVSSQLLQLEKKLGLKLFNRRPFALTPAGEELYDFCYPFFSRLGDVEEQLKGEESRHLRLAASASTLRNHLPDVLEDLKKEEPSLRLSLREVDPSDVHHLLTTQQVDVAVSVLAGRLADGLRAEPLVEIPVALFVPKSIKATSLKQLIEKDPYNPKRFHGAYPLVGLPANEVLQQLFQREFDKRNITWATSVEVNSMEVIRDYVLRDFGVGLGLMIPGLKIPAGIKAIALKDFPPLVIGALYQGAPKALVAQFLETARQRAKSLK
ncbi:LysR family transcriptional regulator [Akkermansiaceae bacterium]|nr:LysR family transcriptional regulator [Akkermansiaceae bacterium]MDB4408720.1 LysR family transcriptional regulator [Akkermansiaceae bacterium]